MPAQQDSKTKVTNWPSQGCGIGFRSKHYDDILENWPAIDWLEAISENFMDSQGRPLRILELIRSRYPVALHGVSLSIGSVDPLNTAYLQKLKNLAERIDPFIVSDHLCWSSVDQDQLHDLLPLPFTQKTLQHIVNRIDEVQNFLGRPLVLENISSYVTFKQSQMSESEFLAQVAKKSGCGLLLDLNNVYVNSKNHQFDPFAYLRNIPAEYVAQFHLARHTDMGSYLFDTHSRPIIPEVWNLYHYALTRYGKVSTLIEWDLDIPELSELLKEADKAKSYYEVAASKPTSITSEMSTPIYTADNNEFDLPLLQRWFRDNIHPSRKADSNTLNALNPQGGVSGEDRLAIYAEGYLERTYEGLIDVYEAILHVLGEGTFRRLAAAYAERFASRTYNLSQIGIYLPEFLKSHSLTKDFPFLPDLATLEWNVASSFHSSIKTPLDPAEISQYSADDWEFLHFSFQENIHLMQSAWPIVDIWEARKKPIKEMNISLVDRSQNILIHRRAMQVLCQSIGSKEYQVLKFLNEGKVLGEVFDLFEEDELAEFPLTEWFSSWMNQQLIVAVTKKPDQITAQTS